MKIETLRKIIAQLENTASHDETRRALNCVEITKTEIRSCDGHIMATTKHNDEDLSTIDDAIYIHRERLPYLKVVFSMHKRIPGVVSSITANQELILDGKIVTEKKDEFKFPNLSQLMPKFTESFSVGLDADLLLSLVKALKEGRKTDCRLTFRAIKKTHLDGRLLAVELDKNSPMIVTSDSNDSSGVLMPVRI